MQLQVECNSLCSKQQLCWICNQTFKMREARVIVCDDQENSYGEICPQCLSRGFNWLEKQFQQLREVESNVVTSNNKSVSYAASYTVGIKSLTEQTLEVPRHE